MSLKTLWPETEFKHEADKAYCRRISANKIVAEIPMSVLNLTDEQYENERRRQEKFTKEHLENNGTDY